MGTNQKSMGYDQKIVVTYAKIRDPRMSPKRIIRVTRGMTACIIFIIFNDDYNLL